MSAAHAEVRVDSHFKLRLEINTVRGELSDL